MNRHTALTRTLLASAAIAVAVALSGCQTDGTFPDIPARALQPLSAEMQAALKQKNMPTDSPILVRLYKEEAELEVWKADTTGQFSLLKTYPICRWSGELGPKVKEGDRQAPEGFYTITAGQMNPRSNYYLAFNLGFPNAYDRANDRTGAFLMIHGDCSSSGCYAMTDEQMGEIYALGRDALAGGQRAFQVQAYPFRMTAANMAKHRNSPHMAFWRMLKEGSDHFELTRLEPKVDVCEKHYVFDAVASGGTSTPVKFDPRGKCPTYELPKDLTAALNDKRAQDEREFAALVNEGAATVAARTGNDGGMHPVFAAKLTPADQYDSDGRTVRVAGTQAGSGPAMPATIINPPKNLAGGDTTSTVSAASTRVAGASSRTGEGGGLLGNVGSTVTGWIGGLRGDKTATRTPAPKAAPAPAKPMLASGSSKPAAAPSLASSSSKPVQLSGRPAGQQPEPGSAANLPKSASALAPAATPASASSSSVMAGAQPVVPSGSFESRWGGLR